MKKACIALTVIFLLSSLLTVCFGAAVGAREIRSILDGDSSWNHLLESIKSWHEHGTGQFLGETHMQFPVDSSKPVCLFFDFAKVSVLSTPDQSASMYVRYYGKNSVDDLSSLPYAEQEDGALHLGLHLPDQNSFTEITVEIYLPMAKYTALNAEVGVGSLTVENMQFGALVSSVKVGKYLLETHFGRFGKASGRNRKPCLGGWQPRIEIALHAYGGGQHPACLGHRGWVSAGVSNWKRQIKKSV